MKQASFVGMEYVTGATLSPCRKYRYCLWREWDSSKGTCVFIGLNPSTGNEKENDATITRCINFAKKWGYGRLEMVNLFGFRAREPNDMKKAVDPVGPDNDEILLKHSQSASLVVAAWSNDGIYNGRNIEVIELLKDIPLKCFKITEKNQPIHPLYQKNDASLKAYTRLK